MICNKKLTTKCQRNTTCTTKSSLKVPLALTQLQAFLYIDFTTLTNHSSSPSFLNVHDVTSLITRSKTFSKSTNAKYKFFFFAKCLYYNCFKIKVTFVFPHHDIKQNCFSSMPTCCLINFSKTLAAICLICLFHSPIVCSF